MSTKPQTHYIRAVKLPCHEKHYYLEKYLNRTIIKISPRQNVKMIGFTKISSYKQQIFDFFADSSKLGNSSTTFKPVEYVIEKLTKRKIEHKENKYPKIVLYRSTYIQQMHFKKHQKLLIIWRAECENTAYQNKPVLVMA